jgi:chromosome segregation ATPase
MSLEDMQTEIETLQSKLASIEDLRKLVENKFNNKKYSKDQYDKQMQRLENDKKRTLYRMEELANMIKKMT